MNQTGPTASTAIVNVTTDRLPLSGILSNEIATFQSPPFGLIAAQTLKPSQNLYTE